LDLGTIYKLNPATKKVTFLHSFKQLADGFPDTALLQANNGNFYGCTFDASKLTGTIYELTYAHSVSTFYTFTSYMPAGPLIQGSDSNFYVAADSTEKGVGDNMLQITLGGTVTILHTFGQGNDGEGVTGAVGQGPNGHLYGLTSIGGTAGKGTVFELSTDGSFYTVLHNFGDGSVPNDGQSPTGGLVVGTDNKLYGTTINGGSAGLGTVFKISP
jgi:uncharacterized repeat protein (TIGR03803 family)